MPSGGDACPEDAEATGGGIGQTLQTALPFAAAGGAAILLISVLS